MIDEPTRNATLVVAHPDDEILWFSGVLGEVDRIIICFLSSYGNPQIGPARARVRDRYPLKNVTWLELTDPRSFLSADWRRPEITAFGLNVRRGIGVRKRYIRAYDDLG